MQFKPLLQSDYLPGENEKSSAINISDIFSYFFFWISLNYALQSHLFDRLFLMSNENGCILWLSILQYSTIYFCAICPDILIFTDEELT